MHKALASFPMMLATSLEHGIIVRMRSSICVSQLPRLSQTLRTPPSSSKLHPRTPNEKMSAFMHHTSRFLILQQIRSTQLTCVP